MYIVGAAVTICHFYGAILNWIVYDLQRNIAIRKHCRSYDNKNLEDTFCYYAAESVGTKSVQMWMAPTPI